MKRYGHGLVIGTFCPPHAGHHHLVRTAEDRCEALTVLVCTAAGELVAARTRARWMAEVHPRVRVVRSVRSVRATGRVDAVFTSERHGDRLARAFGAEHVCVDPERALFPVSAAAVRKDPVGCWDFLERPVRAALTRRVAVLGADPAATTLARSLAERYQRRGGVWAGTRWVPRCGAAREEQAARTGAPVLFCAAGTARAERHLWLLAGPQDGGLPGRGRMVVLRGAGSPALLGAAVDAVDTFLGESWGLDGPGAGRW
ncbi:adenylyltransferase/cytidyltransferase family protein [Streptomyces melanogenes]|uniref:adenylyltransferase/cytidyltransferase family protein n=1 Tax=Streptomyces melanogenes TaxID=67326 RepID=UPI0037BB9D1A